MYVKSHYNFKRSYIHDTYIDVYMIDNFEILIIKTGSSSENSDEKKGTLRYLKIDETSTKEY